MRTIDDQLRVLEPLDAYTTALLAGYANRKQFTDYRAKGRVMPNARLEKLALRLEQLVASIRGMKTTEKTK